MKASIQLDKTATPTLRGKLGINNAPYTAILVLTKPDGTAENIVVPSSDSDEWAVTLERHAPGNYNAKITPRENNAFESTQLHFSL